MVEKNSKKTLILVDGHALAFRSYFALERTAMKNADNQPTWAVYGFFKAIFDILRNPKLKPDAIAVAFDVGRQTFRVDAYPEYKANRETMPDNLHSQIGFIIEGLQAFNIPIFTKEGVEADDVIGTIARRASKLEHKTFILTGDQDSFQLIDEEGCIRVLIPSKGNLIEYDCQKVYEKLGVYPHQIVDYKALRGDTSDNIPGIKGIGEKSAAKLLAQFDNLENIYKNIDNIKEKSLQKKLVEGEEIAKLSQYLATINTDVDIDFDIESTKLVINDLSAVGEFLKKAQFYSFLKNINIILSPFITTQKQISLEDLNKDTENEYKQLGIFDVNVNIQNSQKLPEKNCKINIIENTNDLDNFISKIMTEPIIAVDMILSGKEFWNTDIIGIAISIADKMKYNCNETKFNFLEDSVEQKNCCYISLKGKEKEYLEKLKPVFESSTIGKIIHNSKEKINILRKFGISLSSVIFDTLLACYIKDPAKNQALSFQALENLNLVIKDKDSLSDKNMETIPDEELANFCCTNTSVLLGLTKYWDENLNSSEKKLLYSIELPLSNVLADMEYTGVSIDCDCLQKIAQETDIDLKNIAKRIYELAGEEFNINSPRRVGEILFEKLGIEFKGKKKSKIGYSTNAKILEDLAGDNEIVQKILTHRHLAKIKSVYTDSLPLLVAPFDNRIHTTFNQTVTLTGRLSSSNPNLQNIPIRTVLGNRIRGAFVPKNRKTSSIISADYSQIELRLLAHISGDENMIEAINSGIDIHTLTASKVFNVDVANVSKQMRSSAKAVNFGIIYGQTKYGLAKSINISVKEAQNFIDRYFETYPKILLYMRATKEFAQNAGYVETLYGRRRYLSNELNSSNFQIREFAQRAAINQPIQGTAADLIKIAMINLHKKLELSKLGAKIILQVHDELVLEAYNDTLNETIELVKNEMELGQPLKVPLVVDVHSSESWLERD